MSDIQSGNKENLPVAFRRSEDRRSIALKRQKTSWTRVIKALIPLIFAQNQHLGD